MLKSRAIAVACSARIENIRESGEQFGCALYDTGCVALSLRLALNRNEPQRRSTKMSLSAVAMVSKDKRTAAGSNGDAQPVSQIDPLRQQQIGQPDRDADQRLLEIALEQAVERSDDSGGKRFLPD